MAMIPPDPNAVCRCGLDTSKNGFRYDVVCPKHDGICRVTFPARDARSIPPQAETDSMQIAKAIVNHATKPLVSAERRREIQLFVDTIKLVENAFHCKLRGDTDLSGDILIFDQANPLPTGYEFSAYIEPNGHLEFTEWVLDDEIGIEGMKQ